MSKEFAVSFFPTVTAIVASHATASPFVVNVWNLIFPDDVAKLCEIPSSIQNQIRPPLELYSIEDHYNPRRPCLALAALIGAFVGFKLGTRNRRLLKSNKKTHNILRHDEFHNACKKDEVERIQEARKMLLCSVRDSWSTSLFAFGCMNIVALLHHCIIPPITATTVGDQSQQFLQINTTRQRIDNLLWGADCIMTGVSSTQIIIVAWLLYALCLLDNFELVQEEGHETNGNFQCMIKFKNKRMRQWRNNMCRQWIAEQSSIECTIIKLKRIARLSQATVILVIPVLCHFFYVGTTMFEALLSLTVELAYLVPLLTSTIFLFPLVAIGAVGKFGFVNEKILQYPQCNGAHIAVCGGLLIVASLPLDAPLCKLVTSHAPNVKESFLFYDIHHLPTILFAGCDVAFLGLDMWLDALIRNLSLGYAAKKDI